MRSLTIEKTILTSHVSVGMNNDGGVVIKFEGQAPVTVQGNPFGLEGWEMQGQTLPEPEIEPEHEPNPQLRPLKVRKGSSTETVVEFLSAHPDDGFSLAELVAQASRVSESAVFTGLKRLVSEGHIEKFKGLASNGRKALLYRMAI